jgi:hypothetical protein
VVSRRFAGTSRAAPAAMRRVLPLLLLSFAASPALANPLVMGATIGLEQAKSTSQTYNDTSGSQLLGLFGRMTLSGRLAGQLELARIATPDNSQMDVRVGTALLVYDLASGPLVPVLLAGAGAAQQSMTYGSQTFVHAEAGIGLELRVKNGFILGVDARIGTRSNTTGPIAMPESYYAPISPIAEGEYRSLRLGLGVTF